MHYLTLLWWLILGHFVADYPLQADWISANKDRRLNKTPVPWPYVLSGHAATHAAAVGLITGSPPLSLLEFAAHWIIDAAKCEGWTGIHTDQALHVGTKALIAVLACAA